MHGLYLRDPLPLGRMKHIKCLLLDIGNVVLLFDNHKVSRRLAQITGQDEVKIFRFVFSLYIDMELDTGKTLTHTFLNLIKRKLSLKLDLPSLKYIFDDIFTENEKVCSLLRLLKGKIPLIGITNTNESHFDFIVDQYDILNLFDYIITSFELGIKKPDTGIYVEALKHAKALPQECFFTDDQEKNIVPASLLGFNTHCFRNYEELARELEKLKIL